MRAAFIAVSLLLAFALGIAATLLFVHRQAQSRKAPSGQTDARVLYWYDPMVPQQHFDAPGKSPFMDMQLVPKYAGEASPSEGTVSIDPRLTQNLGVRTAKVERGSLVRTVRATGTLAFDERAITVVQSRVAGIVEKLRVRAPLSSVRQGEPLITLLAPDWTAAQEEYLSLRRAKSGGLDELRAAARQRLVLIGMDEAQIRAIERTGRAQTRITIAAPRKGVVTDLAVREGATVAAGAPLMTINGLDDVWMNAAVQEIDSGGVGAGAAVKASLPAFPGETFEGKVETLLPDLDPATRTQKARIVLPNPEGRLAPGMFASVEIMPSTAASTTLLVPSEAIISTGTRSVVIVDDGRGHFRAQEVRVGNGANRKIAVREGLREGESVVLSGQFLIDSEANLAGALARLSSGAGPGSMTSATFRSETPATPAQHLATGKVERIDDGKLTIAIDANPSLDMGAMTMTFRASSQAPPTPVRPGHRVRFSFFRNGHGEFEIKQIAVLDASSAKSNRP